MPLSPTNKKKFREALASYCREAEVSRLQWHYVQARPFTGYDLPPSAKHAADCSAFVGLAFNYAMYQSKVAIHDPLNERYSGW